MKISLNLVRPDFAFVMSWLIVLACYLPFTTPLTPPFERNVAWVLGFNMLTAPMILNWVNRRVVRRLGPQEITRPVVTTKNLLSTHKFLHCIFFIWLGVFVVSIVYSGGLPLFWVLSGSSKTYSDFGIPTIGGISVLLRSTSACLSIFLFITTRERRYVLIWGFIMILCMMELSRSALLMLSAQSVCTFLMLHRMKMKQLLLGAGVVLVSLGMFVALGSLRGIDINAADFQISALFGVPPAVYGAWAYIVSPLGNVNHAAALGITPLYFPKNILSTFVPSVIGAPLGLRSAAAPVPLIVRSLTATSIYGPLIADLGYAGAAVFISALQILASYAYVMARRGRLIFIIFYPALFGSLVFSIFYIYVMNLQILFVPVMAIWLRRFIARRQGQDNEFLPSNSDGNLETQSV